MPGRIELSTVARGVQPFKKTLPRGGMVQWGLETIMGALLDGKSYANRILAEVKAEVAARLAAGGSTPCLAVVLVGEDPASEVYVRGKVRACAETGIRSLEHKLPAATDQAALEAVVDALNADPSSCRCPSTWTPRPSSTAWIRPRMWTASTP